MTSAPDVLAVGFYCPMVHPSCGDAAVLAGRSSSRVEFWWRSLCDLIDTMNFFEASCHGRTTSETWNVETNRQTMVVLGGNGPRILRLCVRVRNTVCVGPPMIMMSPHHGRSGQPRGPDRSLAGWLDAELWALSLPGLAVHIKRNLGGETASLM